MALSALKTGIQVVIWDTGSTNHYVHNSHARRMGFPRRRETLRVLTIGEDVKTINWKIYKCQILDKEGFIYEFLAHELDELPGI